ncbi:reverse transcriptase [Gossypium australe]|uniref:Reverse transcriptase n=1 Tax=Gossypium australe TaxID=47621 RepID=A0A5B6W7M4_9ROSI|nr:reverse transcriptase [Gossypium australe]
MLSNRWIQEKLLELTDYQEFFSNSTRTLWELIYTDPCDFTNFRPINLCRYIYKIIAKVLANSAFVPGRMIHDNIFITHELLHYHQNTRYNFNKGCVVKLDMSKAYDLVEWSFIEEVMRRMGFAN